MNHMQTPEAITPAPGQPLDRLDMRDHLDRAAEQCEGIAYAMQALIDDRDADLSVKRPIGFIAGHLLDAVAPLLRAISDKLGEGNAS